MITQFLFANKDEEYKRFSSSLIPTIEPEKVIGVRTPVLRKFAKDIVGREETESFLSALPHTYYEENNLHAYILSSIKDFDKCVELVDAFLPYVDNWATCDGMRPKCFAKKPQRLLPYVKRWLGSKHVYTQRYAVGMLMSYYLDDAFCKEYLDWVAGIKSDEYYVNMMIAWYFATALAKQWDLSVAYIEKGILPDWTHNKTIQKAIESFRITADKKSYLKAFKKGCI